MAPASSNGHVDDLGLGFADLLLSFRQAQLRVLAAVSADPAALVDVLDEADAAPDLFEDDLFAIHAGLYCGARMNFDPVYQGSQLPAARCCRLALRQLGYWSDADHWGQGETWTLRRLIRLFESDYPCRPTARMYADRLVRVYQRLRDARSHLDFARRLVGPDPEDLAWMARFNRRGVA